MSIIFFLIIDTINYIKDSVESQNLVCYREERNCRDPLSRASMKFSLPFAPSFLTFDAQSSLKLQLQPPSVRDDEGGKCDGSQVLISAFRRDARDSKRRKNGWNLTRPGAESKRGSWCSKERGFFNEREQTVSRVGRSQIQSTHYDSIFFLSTRRPIKYTVESYFFFFFTMSTRLAYF